MTQIKLTDCLLKEKVPLKLPEVRKEASCLDVLMEKYNDYKNRIGESIKDASEFATDAVLGIDVLVRRTVGINTPMARYCDDRRAAKTVLALSGLLALALAFAAYKGGKSYFHHQTHQNPKNHQVSSFEME